MTAGIRGYLLAVAAVGILVSLAAALLPKVAGAGHVVLEEQDQAAYRIDAATVDQLEEIRGKIEVLGGKVALVLKQLAD